jgi:hypothetical protein
LAQAVLFFHRGGGINNIYFKSNQIMSCF